MTLSIDDITPLHDGRGAPVKRRPVLDGRPDRRTLLKVGVGAAASVATLKFTKLFKGTPAAADPTGDPGYVLQGGCDNAGYSQYEENCNRPCGPSSIVADACVTSGYYAGFHKNTGTCHGCYTLRPGQCNDVDGWKWNHSYCEPCYSNNPPRNQKTAFRCHDGWKNYTDGTSRKPTICKVAVGCVD